jgi:hypothetical protein
MRLMFLLLGFLTKILQLYLAVDLEQQVTKRQHAFVHRVKLQRSQPKEV